MKKYQAPIKTSAQLAEVKAAYKPLVKLSEQPKIMSSYDTYEYLRQVWDEDTLEYKESMYMILMNRNNRVLGWVLIGTGGTSGVVADPKIIFQHGLTFNAAYLILAHNHPSGNLKPSSEDLRITNRVVELGKMLDLPVVDHLIVTESGYYSFADEGLM